MSDKNESQGSNAQLDALLESWQVPPPSPWLVSRTAHAIAATVDARHSTLPMSLWRFAVATATAAAVGMVLGFAMPTTDAANAAVDSDEIIEMMW